MIKKILYIKNTDTCYEELLTQKVNEIITLVNRLQKEYIAKNEALETENNFYENTGIKDLARKIYE